MMSALPPRSGESPSRRGGGVSRLAMMQARFQAKQLEEKEEKLIHMLEEKQAGYFNLLQIFFQIFGRGY